MDDFTRILVTVCRRFLYERDFAYRNDLKVFCRDYYQHSASPKMASPEFTRRITESGEIHADEIPRLTTAYNFLFYPPAGGDYVARSLKHLSRLAVIRQVTLAEKGGVDGLPIPRLLKLYLKFEL